MTSRLVPGRTPQPGLSPVADAIRARRGERGLTPLDSVLLHVPAVAEGWNTLLGAVRTRGKLPGDIRELMILRVAAVNRAAYEWIHHEPVGRTHGLTTAQLYVVRDVSTPLPPADGILSSLQLSALRFADSSTRDVQVPNQVTRDLMQDLGDLVKVTHAKDQEEKSEEEEIQDLFVEAAAVVGTYNMVSRFLVSTDVAGLSDSEVPWPVERKEHFFLIPSDSDPTTHTHKIHAITLTTSHTAPWIVFANSLLTDLTMWSYTIPYFLQNSFNLLLHSQRGHGQSTLPPPSPSYRQTTIPSLAYDIAHLLHSLHIPTPIHAIIGVSQGGAAALAFSALPDFFPTSLPSPLPTTKSIIACDTAARTPAGNREAWEERAGLVFGVKVSFDPRSSSFPSALPLDDEYANKLGMPRLAAVTVPRWFSSGSTLSSASNAYHPERTSWISSLITHTPPRGFLAGAQALADYDLLSDSDAQAGILRPTQDTLPSVPRVLLLAGALDGAGKVGKGLKHLAERWANLRGDVAYAELPESGHLPMIDQPERWWSVISDFL